MGLGVVSVKDKRRKSNGCQSRTKGGSPMGVSAAACQVSVFEWK